MTRRGMLLFLGLNMVGIGFPASAADGPRRPVTVVHTERLNFAAGGVIQLNGSYGHLTVEGWDEPEVEVTVTKSTEKSYTAGQQQEANRRLESIRVVTGLRSASELSITTILASRNGTWAPPLPRNTKNGVTLEYQIHAPRGSKLVIEHGGGIVLVSGMAEDVEVTSASGDILLMLPDSGAYNIDARSKLGTVSSDFEGAARRRRLVGSGFVRATQAPSHRIFARTRRGGIAIKSVPPPADPPAGARDR